MPTIIMKELLFKLAKLLPKDLQHKLTMWFLKRKMKQIFPVSSPALTPERIKSIEDKHGVKIEVTPLSEKDAMQMMKDPSFLKALEQLRKAQKDNTPS